VTTLAEPTTLRVLLVDDHHLLAQTMAIALGPHGVAATLAPLHSPAAVLEAAEEDAYDLVLLDLDLGGALGDGADLVPGLVATGSRVLVVTGTTNEGAVGRALELGAIGAVSKALPFDRLLPTVVAAARGEAVMDLEARRSLLREARETRRAQQELRAPFEQLSQREDEVLRALGDGWCVTEIAAAAYVSEATVRSQVRGVLTKLGVTSQLAAVAAARRAGWLA
jgi:DNA-binding NarL/FixJ family response regulator